jgi:hypothetical protein
MASNYDCVYGVHPSQTLKKDDNDNGEQNLNHSPLKYPKVKLVKEKRIGGYGRQGNNCMFLEEKVKNTKWDLHVMSTFWRFVS